MGPRLVCDTYDDIRGRCDTAPVRQAGSEPGYDRGAIVPGVAVTGLLQLLARR
ncbi:hypothetical protein AB0O07_32220 [Streptomyces sp. NPDC093085]|uniref:hypothetical protein n=1 Tax=Streptomyces sp. NPDC093085 TaxID=3155068 RepID=UPI0034453254